MVEQIESGAPRLENAYPRAVTLQGNLKAQKILAEVFEPADACWRGIGLIPLSGLRIREAYSAHDAVKRFTLNLPEAKPPKGCACGEILTGKKTPPSAPSTKRCARLWIRWDRAWFRAKDMCGVLPVPL